MATKKIKGSLSIENVLELPSYTQNSVLVINGSGQAAASTVTTTSLDYISNVSSDIQGQLDAKIATDSINQAGGVCGLDGSGKIGAAQLPSYVDDVLEYANLAAFPATGEAAKIYVALDTNKTYRWSGSTYVEIASGAVSSVFGRSGAVTAQAGDYTASQVNATTSGPFVGSTVQAILDELGNTYIPDAILTTPGDLMIGASGSGDASRLGIGSEGQVLTVSSGAPVWSTPSSAPVEFSDSSFKVYDDVNTDRKVRFELSGLTSAGDKVITMPDSNVDLGDIATNNAKVSNATHTGDVTGDVALTLQSVAITGQAAATIAGTDLVLISDADDSGNLKKVTAQDIANLASAGVSSLDGLSDVTFTGPEEQNDILIRNAAGQFVDKVLSGGTGIIVNTTASAVGFDLDISGMTELAEASNQPTSDQVALFDGSLSDHKKISVKNLTGRAVGDIYETEFTLPTGNLATTATDLTGLSFSNTNVRSFEAQVVFEASTDSVTGGSVEVYKLLGLSRSLTGEAATWDLAVESVGDNVNVSFTITTEGQVQYSFPSATALPSGTYDSDSGNFRFRASTISTASGQSV
jgi:hypothetical protein